MKESRNQVWEEGRLDTAGKEGRVEGSCGGGSRWLCLKKVCQRQYESYVLAG